MVLEMMTDKLLPTPTLINLYREKKLLYGPQGLEVMIFE